MTAGQLAKSAELTPASVTAILDQLETADIVERRRNAEDRRVCNVVLTPAGWRLLERKLAGWRSLWDERLSRFDDDDLAAAVEILRAVAGVYESVSDELDRAAHEPRSSAPQRRRQRS
jgi:DNA-binding MarR family transcriptional regulator